MAVQYFYNNVPYASEAEAQEQVVSMKSRLQNNPTDWCVVKELQENGDGTYLVTPVELTDTQIKNPDPSKQYLAYSIFGGGHYMNLLSAELSERVAEFRSEYFNHKRLNYIIRVENDSDGNFISADDITPNEDMSGYI